MLTTVLLEEEIKLIPENVASKIEKAFDDSSEQYLTLKAVFETFKHEQGIPSLLERNFTFLPILIVFCILYRRGENTTHSKSVISRARKERKYRFGI